MITTSDLNEMRNTSQSQYREYRISTRAAMKALEAAYKEHELDTIIPAYVAAVGYSEAVRLIASLVNACDYDGRIHADVKAWAASIDTAADHQAADALDLYTSIHRAHLNQIAHEMMQYTPETSETAPAECETLCLTAQKVKDGTATAEYVDEKIRHYAAKAAEWRGYYITALGKYQATKEDLWHAQCEIAYLKSEIERLKEA